MLNVIVFLLLAPGSSQPEANFRLRDRLEGATPVTDKDLRPVKLPDCRTDADVQRTLEQISYGEQGECFIKDIKAFSRR